MTYTIQRTAVGPVSLTLTGPGQFGKPHTSTWKGESIDENFMRGLSSHPSVARVWHDEAARALCIAGNVKVLEHSENLRVERVEEVAA